MTGRKLGAGTIPDEVKRRMQGQKGSIVGTTPGLTMRVVDIRRNEVYSEHTEEYRLDEATGVVSGGMHHRSRLFAAVEVLFCVEVSPCEGADLDHYTKVTEAVDEYIWEQENGSTEFVREPAKSGYMLERTQVEFFFEYDPTERRADPSVVDESDKHDDTGFYLVYQEWRS